MNFVISHKGLNPRKVASKLHDMINEANKNRLKKKFNEGKDIDPDPEKKMFADAFMEKEIDFLAGGFNNA